MTMIIETQTFLSWIVVINEYACLLVCTYVLGVQGANPFLPDCLK